MTLVQTEPKKICMVQPSRLPSEYQEVEYIETTGTQFIDTAVFPSNSIQVETDIEVTQTAQDKPVFGTYRIGTNNNDSISGYYHLTCYSNKWYYGLNGSEGNAGTYSPVAGTKYSIIYNNTTNKLVVNNNEIATLTGTTGQSGCTLTISRRGWSSGSGNRYGQYKFYNFKMYDKSINEYVRDFVPCYRKADSVIGMYDLVNDTFYTNSGSGTFTKGNDVNFVEQEIKRVTIRPNGTEKQIRPSLWQPGANTYGYYTFDDQNANQITDFSGNHRNLTGGTMPSYTLVSGTNYAGNYTNVNTGAAPSVSFATLGTTFTMLVWVKPTTNSSCYCAYIGDTSGTVNQLAIIYGYNSNQFEYFSENGYRTTINSSASINNWYLVGFTRSGSVIQTYSNGIAGNSISSFPSVVYNKFYLGSSISGDRLKGQIGECVIEDKVRIAQEVQDYYNQTKGNYGL